MTQAARGAVGEYLRARRARVSPGSLGLPDDGRARRVAGLRREEVAILAGVSVDYYVRLERGRTRGVSRSVWESLARALQLDEVERAHLFDLVAAETALRLRTAPLPRQRASRGLVSVLDSMDQVPAMLQGRRTDVLAFNDLFRALYGEFCERPPRDRNLARFILLDPAAQALFPEWNRVARDTVSSLRMYAGSHADDPELAELVGELSLQSDLFRRAWVEHDVMRHSTGHKRFLHPAVGALTLNYETFQVAGDADQTLVVFHADAGSPSADALQLLGAWAASEATSRSRSRSPGAALEA